MTSQPQLSTTPAEAPERPMSGRSTDLIEPIVAGDLAIERRGAWQFLGRPAVKPLLVGFLGSVILAIGGFGAGGVLVHDPLLEGTPLVAWRFGHGYNLAVMVCYLGLGLELWAWVMLGRDVLARRANSRAVLTTAALWILPMLVSAPLFTRDPYSYIAYGTMALHGLDPYGGGPSVLSGPVPDNVHWFWLDTPSPYEPLFIAIAKAVVAVTGHNMIVGVLLMRLAMVVGLVLFVAALPGLVRHLGGHLPTALWIAVANPVMVFHLIGGPHNDLLTVGFLAVGALLALNRKHAAGIALVSMAAAVKATAALALPFLVLVWAARLRGDRRARILKAAGASIAVFVGVFAVWSAIAKVGLGWIPALNAPSNIVNWLSLPTGVGQLIYTVVGWIAPGVSQTPFVTVTRVIGVLAFLAISVRQWKASRDGGPDAVRRAGIVLLLFALLAPAALPWYYTWGMALLAATAWSVPRMQVATVASIFLIIAAFPDGEVSLYALGYLLLCMAGALVAAKALRSPDPLRLRPGRYHRPAVDG
jgi:alpha-1,6-mannosyltransferase